MSDDIETGGRVEQVSPPAPVDARLQALYPNDVPKEPEAPSQAPIDAEAKPAEPNTGEYQLTMPEGVTVDPELLTAATPVLRGLGLSDEQASKLVPLAQQVQDRFVSGMEAHHAETRANWMRDAKADSTLGGANWNESVRVAQSALTIGGAGPGSEVRKLLDESGLGNHPAFIRLFRNIGLKLSGGTVRPASREELWYPAQAKR